MKQQHCDQCENQCPVEALQCGKGRKHFGLEPAGEGGHGQPSGPIGLLRQCGHMLHHGGASGEDLLRALTPGEQAELERLLGILAADWQSRCPAGKSEHRPPHQE